MRWAVEVSCAGDRRVGWTCFAAIREVDRTVSEHEIRVTPGDLAHLAPSAPDPTDLVERSLAFLLERESPASILRTFNLTVIGEFFPAYEATIRRRVGGG
jgi:hypothetical protein